MGRWDPDGRYWVRRAFQVAVREIATCTGNTFGGFDGLEIWAQGLSACWSNIGLWNFTRLTTWTRIEECGWEVFGMCWGGWHTLNQRSADSNIAPVGFVWTQWTRAFRAPKEAGVLYRIITVHQALLKNPFQTIRGVTGREIKA